MKVSISVADRPSPMPQIMFCGGLEKDFRFLAEAGFDGVDLFFPNPKESDAKAVRKLLDDFGLRATMLASQGDIMKDGLFLNMPEKLDEILERSKYHLEQCAVLGAKPNIGFIRGKHNGNPNSLKYMAEGCAAYCELAASMGVDVLLENINRYEIDSILTAGSAMELWKMSGSPENLTILLDIFHANIEEPSICSAIYESAGRIGHVHFVDNTRSVPGTGCLNLGDIVGCLHQSGYTGFLGIEAIPGANPADEAKSGLAYTRMLLANHSA